MLKKINQFSHTVQCSSCPLKPPSRIPSLLWLVSSYTPEPALLTMSPVSSVTCCPSGHSCFNLVSVVLPRWFLCLLHQRGSYSFAVWLPQLFQLLRGYPGIATRENNAFVLVVQQQMCLLCNTIWPFLMEKSRHHADKLKMIKVMIHQSKKVVHCQFNFVRGNVNNPKYSL